ncbi:hypothetical protein EKH57_02105 [Halorubrum sp. BOL3-1]|uniref:hypothetical protein n=1 Tax=Halorubrum sp. BOL3-1 TaxID=2497325 RepID=UPI0010050DDF|nr:hypothetical protein [Halorubrum sp. BOL3-1]QAU11653.1 hypothetical protein EKH57_02105 [Halorubrum sp. BOL3-1]
MSPDSSPLNEDRLQNQIEQEVYEQNRQLGLRLLAYIYSVDPDDIDVDPDYAVPRGETVMTEGSDEAVETIKWQLNNLGRTGTLYSLIGNLKVLYPDDEEQKLLLFVELSECQHFLERDEPFAALIRGATFLEKTLSERLSSSSDLAYLIQEARDEGVISTKEEALAQFVRECRNDAGHNFWLETEFSYVVHEHAVLTLICLLDSLLERWYRTRWNLAIPELSPERCLRIIRGEFGFTWGASDGLQQWITDPMNERYDRRIEIN